MQIFKYNLGDRAKDHVTGFTGIIIQRTDYLNGCIRYGVQPEKLQEGKPVDAYYFDEDQIFIIKANVLKSVTKPTGGPAPVTKGLPNPK